MSASSTHRYPLVPKRWISATASCARRLGPEPIGDGHESPPRRSAPAPASTPPERPGPRSSVCPSRRSLPPDLGIIRSRTGNGQNVPELQTGHADRPGTPAPPVSASMSRTVSPSTPAVRAPVLPATRSNATSSSRRVCHQIEQIIEPASSIAHRPTVSLPASPLPGPRPIASRPRALRGSPAHLPALPASFHCSIRCRPSHVTGSPGSKYYGGSAPLSHRRSKRLSPARRPAAPGSTEQTRNSFPCSLYSPFDGGGARLCPCGITDGYPADIPRGLPPGRPTEEFPAGTDRCAPLPAISARFDPVSSSRRFTTLVPRVLLSVSLAGPAPSGSTSTSRHRQGCSHPPRHHPDPAASSFIAPLRQAAGEGLSPPRSISASWRTSPGARFILLVQRGLEHRLRQLLAQPVRTGQRQALVPGQPDQLRLPPAVQPTVPPFLPRHVLQCRGHHGTFPTGHQARRVRAGNTVRSTVPAGSRCAGGRASRDRCAVRRRVR